MIRLMMVRRAVVNHQLFPESVNSINLSKSARFAISDAMSETSEDCWSLRFTEFENDDNVLLCVIDSNTAIDVGMLLQLENCKLDSEMLDTTSGF